MVVSRNQLFDGQGVFFIANSHNQQQWQIALNANHNTRDHYAQIELPRITHDLPGISQLWHYHTIKQARQFTAVAQQAIIKQLQQANILAPHFCWTHQL